MIHRYWVGNSRHNIPGQQSPYPIPQKMDRPEASIADDSTLRLVDCHAHLLPPHVDAADVDAMLRRAVAGVQCAGVGDTQETAVFTVERVLVVSESPRDFPAAMRLRERWPRVVPAVGVGLHPAEVHARRLPLADGAVEGDTGITETDSADERLERAMRALADCLTKDGARVACVGECGLDRHVFQRGKSQDIPFDDDAGWARQVRALEFQAELATRHRLPMNVHSRQAGHYAIDLLRRCGVQHAMLHAFDGQFKYARAAVECGFYLSVPPSVVRCVRIALFQSLLAA